MFVVGLGLILAAFSGIFSGGSNWPVKCFRTYQYEHWTLIYLVLGIVLLPLALVSCFVSPLEVLSSIPAKTLLLVAGLSASWGVANIIAGIALVKVGFGMTLGLLIGIGLPIGIFFPMVFRAESMASGAPGVFTATGCLLAVGSLVAIAGVFLIAQAGNMREKAARMKYNRSFLWMILLITAGVLQVGLAMSLVYGQPAFGSVFKAAGMNGVLQEFAVSSYCMFCGALLNIAYVLYLMIKHRSFGVFLQAPQREFYLSFIIGIHLLLSALLLVVGMKFLGSLGPSIGFGSYQIAMLITGQTIGLCTGEWSSVPQARRLVYGGIALLLLGTVILAASKFFSA